MQRVCLNAVGTSPTLSTWSTAGVFTTAACPIVCEAPSGLTTTSITQTSAVLNWNPNSTPTALYNLQYHSATSNTWITINNVTMPYTLGNLSCGSGYAWRVQRVCSSTITNVPIVSAWTTSTFSTQACTTAVCEPPLGLVATNISQTGAVLNCTPNTPNTLYNLQYHGPNTTNWTTLNNIPLPFQLGNLGCGLLYEWRLQRVCLNTAGTAPSLSNWSTAGVFTTAACPIVCEAPSGLTTTNITQTSAVLYWGTTPIAGNVFNLRYRNINATAWITVNNVSLPYQLGNLACGNAFIWQVQRICNTTPGTVVSFSNWSVAANFNTLTCTNPNPCAIPTGLITTNINQNSAVLNSVSPTSTGLYNIRYRRSNTTAWIFINNVSMPFQLGNLSCGSGYLWQAHRVCGTASGANSLVSDWSLISTFSTSLCVVPCSAPTELTANNITQTSAVLNWGAVSGAVAYIVNYRQANNTSALITVTATTNSITVNGLIPGASYIYQVRAICAIGTVGTNMSPFSINYLFTTPTALVIHPNPANDILRVSINLEQGESVNIQLRDSFGQLVSSINELALEGLNEFNINTVGISEGIYLLSVNTKSDTTVSKVFIKH